MSQQKVVGIVAGTGLNNLLTGKTESINTRYGKAMIVRGMLDGKQFLFIPRHGPEHTIPPQEINHKANFYALFDQGATDLLSITAVGSLRKWTYKPGNLVIIKDFSSLEKGATLFDSFEPGNPMHAPMGEPYSPQLVQEIKNLAKAEGIKLKGGAVLGQTAGPRFETAHEVKLLRSMGIDLVGMTSLSETIIANELKLLGDIRNATIGIVTNFGTGLVKRVNHADVEKVVAQASEQVGKIVTGLIRSLE